MISAAQAACAAAFVISASVSLTAGALKRVGAILPDPPPSSPSEVQSATHATEEPTKEPTAPAEPDGGAPIIKTELSLSDGSGDILFKNETDYTFDTSSLLNSGYPIEPAGDEPSVLILHTHATECYTEEGHSTVTDTRSSDPKKNVTAVGEVLAEELSVRGIGVIHCTVQHDAEDYSGSYIYSKKTVEEYLQKYPGIKYVIDLHRDAIATPDGGMAKPIITKDGTDLAQMMLVVGTDEAGADHPAWRTNLCVAVRTQTELVKYEHSLMRPINLRSASFNQQLCHGYLLLEIGSCANTLEEAKASARVFAEIFAKLIKNP